MLCTKLKKANGNVNSDSFEMFADTNIVDLNPIDIVSVKNAQSHCSLKCIRNDQCDAFTSEPMDPRTGLINCKLYAILRDNHCIANVTQVTSVGTSFYKKKKKGINAICKASKECTTAYGLDCIRGKCSCNQTQ